MTESIGPEEVMKNDRNYGSNSLQYLYGDIMRYI